MPSSLPSPHSLLRSTPHSEDPLLLSRSCGPSFHPSWARVTLALMCVLGAQILRPGSLHSEARPLFVPPRPGPGPGLAPTPSVQLPRKGPVAVAGLPGGEGDEGEVSSGGCQVTRRIKARGRGRRYCLGRGRELGSGPLFLKPGLLQSPPSPIWNKNDRGRSCWSCRHYFSGPESHCRLR